ncbi:hypothetical protein Q5752_002219 [Cryptotrichosporon argae]
MAATGPPAPVDGPWTRPARALDDWLINHKVVFSATTASLFSTFAGFPLDSLKSRLQSSRESISIPRLAADVIREEGVGGLWRGFPLPLVTISIVRTISFTIYTSTKRILNSIPGVPSTPDQTLAGAGGRTADTSGRPAPPTPWIDVRLGLFTHDSARDVALTSALAGGASGAIVCLGSAPFELVKVRRQLEYQIWRDKQALAGVGAGTQAAGGSPSAPAPAAASHAASPSFRRQYDQPSHAHHASSSSSAAASLAPARPQAKAPKPFVPPTTLQAVRAIVEQSGPLGLWTGFRLHFVRDTLGTALYFAEYDVFRFWLGRKRADPAAAARDGQGQHEGARGLGLVQGDLPDWARAWLPQQLVPFLCGSVAGVTSWALIYPVDAIKTKAQQRALSGLGPRTPLAQFLRLVRGTDPAHPKPLLMGIARLYRGLGVSMARSMLTHGLLWTIVDWTGAWIDTRPIARLVA